MEKDRHDEFLRPYNREKGRRLEWRCRLEERHWQVGEAALGTGVTLAGRPVPAGR
jgi:hypothetical protein